MVRVIALAVVLLIAGGAYVVISRIHASSVAHDQAVVDVQTKITDAKGLLASYQRHSATIEALWDKADDARRTGLQMGDQHPPKTSDPSADLKAVADQLRTEETKVDQMDQFATQASIETTAALGEFADRYGPSSVTTAQGDLAGAISEIHNESKEWKGGLDDMLGADNLSLDATSYFINDTRNAKFKAELDASEQSASNANAARDTLQSDLDALVAKVNAEITKEAAGAH